jgi:GMP synthase (glutamine-hydrolysing)
MLLETDIPVSDKPILILLAGKTFPEISKSEHDFDDWIAAALGSAAVHKRMDARTVPALPDPSGLAGVVISGSHAMVTDREPWSERLAVWLKTCVDLEIPTLGICYGHQLLAHAVGGVVGDRPAGIEIGTRTIALTANATHDYLFREMPQAFPAQLVHSQSVLKLPAAATLLGWSQHESHQAFRIGRCAWGVQFHPEFSAQAMRGYINQMQQLLTDQQYNCEELSTAVTATPDAARLLRRFATLCAAEEKQLGN